MATNVIHNEEIRARLRAIAAVTDPPNAVHKPTDAETRILAARQKQARAARIALERLDAGGYGRCLDCDDGINQARLDAYPSALLCIDCQAAREDRG